ncbi:MAG: HEAT repeat domain-containing protein [Pyrinomonadaceae bacterium]
MNGNNGSLNVPPDAAAPAAAPVARRRSPLPLAILAAIFIIVPFLAWYGTWFGRALSDEDIRKYLADEKNPRHVQHALSQIVERIQKGDASVKRWYPQIVALSGSPMTEIRQTAAWAMGQDHQSEEFHAALVRLLADKEPIVRRNAATGLVRFKDGSGRPELRSMLQPYAVAAPLAGTIMSVLPEGSQVKMGSLLARIKQGEGQIEEMRSPLSGKIGSIAMREGSMVAVGDTVLSITPDVETVENALIALSYVGTGEDLPVVEPYAQGVEGMPQRIKEEAALTAKAIQSRMDNRP